MPKILRLVYSRDTGRIPVSAIANHSNSMPIEALLIVSWSVEKPLKNHIVHTIFYFFTSLKGFYYLIPVNHLNNMHLLAVKDG